MQPCVPPLMSSLQWLCGCLGGGAFLAGQGHWVEGWEGVLRSFPLFLSSQLCLPPSSYFLAFLQLRL